MLLSRIPWKGNKRDTSGLGPRRRRFANSIYQCPAFTPAVGPAEGLNAPAPASGSLHTSLRVAGTGTRASVWLQKAVSFRKWEIIDTLLCWQPAPPPAAGFVILHPLRGSDFKFTVTYAQRAAGLPPASQMLIPCCPAQRWVRNE